MMKIRLSLAFFKESSKLEEASSQVLIKSVRIISLLFSLFSAMLALEHRSTLVQRICCALFTCGGDINLCAVC